MADTRPNLQLPGNPRYQPKDLLEIFGYDNLARALVQVELSALHTLGEVGTIPREDYALLTHELEGQLLSITTSAMDKVEREITKHDIRALVRLMQEVLPPPLRRWVHVPLTSYDVIDTARVLQFQQAHDEVVRLKIKELIGCLKDQALEHIDDVQIGRTHGQHATPITAGFWFATILSRVLTNAEQMEQCAKALVGKISGPVGAYNAQAALGISGIGGIGFEDRVLGLLDLQPAPISTQILPPEPLAYYLFSCVMLSAALGQFGRDARNLMRTEIGEIGEPFEKGQVGSSTMAHKRNPMTFENIEGMWERNVGEFAKLMLTLISEHQRDLTGSCVSRDFPIIIVNLVQQLDALLKKGKEDPRPFVSRIKVDAEACKRNFRMQGDRILAEPIYLALQMHGYEGDAHELVNHRAMPLVDNGTVPSLYGAIFRLADHDAALKAALQSIPPETLEILRNPERYTGKAGEKVQEICKAADEYLASLEE